MIANPAHMYDSRSRRTIRGRGLRARVALGCLLLAVFSAHSTAQVKIAVGDHRLDSSGTNRTLVIPILASGLERVSDMSIVFQVGDGGPAVGGSSSPIVSGVSFANSIWNSLSGGVEIFPPSLPSQIVRFSVAANQPGRTLPASGELFRIELDAFGFSSGQFALKLAQTKIGLTAFYGAGAEIPAEIQNGSLQLQASTNFVSAPAIAITRSGNAWQLAFRTESGYRYQVQWASNPLPGLWRDAGPPLSGTGQTSIWSDDGSLTGGTARQKYYRVSQNPNP